MFKISIKARIEDYDASYKKFFQDKRAAFFEKQKFRLRKLLHESRNLDDQRTGEVGMIYYEPVKTLKSNGTFKKGINA